jgi:hypothetical protein
VVADGVMNGSLEFPEVKESSLKIFPVKFYAGIPEIVLTDVSELRDELYVVLVIEGLHEFGDNALRFETHDTIVAPIEWGRADVTICDDREFHEFSPRGVSPASLINTVASRNKGRPASEYTDMVFDER